MKKALKIILIALLVIVLLVAALFAYLTVTALDPEKETAVITHGENSTETVKTGEELTILTWNVGYCGLGEESDFFMDGGEQTRIYSKDIVQKNIDGVVGFVKDTAADFTFLQEIDRGKNTHSYGLDEYGTMLSAVRLDTAHSLNYKCDFVPYPLPPIGKISCGIMTLSHSPITDAQRIALPSPFTWPVSVANLKRCMMPVYIDIEGTDKQLVLINFHLEAYDNGEGKIAQTKALNEFMLSEYAKGNYVIAGGDWNQCFPGALDRYPNTHPELWEPGILLNDSIPENWSFAYDISTPTCRLLNQPYDPADTVNTQYYVIDGFVVSPNVTVSSAETVDLEFKYSDHNPVLLTFTLAE